MDTTLEVIRLYHTAIHIAVLHNVGIPVACAFGSKEWIELYNSFYAAFDELSINIRTYILESDQGSALKSVGRRPPRHLFCLRLVLPNLVETCGRFAGLIGNLIRAGAQQELNLLVGLVVHTGEMCYEDPDRIRWRQMSMLERVGRNMPSTSHTIEGMNGHINEYICRRDTFWASHHRLTGAIKAKYEFRKFDRRTGPGPSLGLRGANDR
jgi:hypothetical protein